MYTKNEPVLIIKESQGQIEIELMPIVVGIISTELKKLGMKGKK